MPMDLPLKDGQVNLRHILLANAILVVPGATDRISNSAEPQPSPKKVRFPLWVTYNQLLIPQGEKLLDSTPSWKLSSRAFSRLSSNPEIYCTHAYLLLIYSTSLGFRIKDTISEFLERYRFIKIRKSMKIDHFNCKFHKQNLPNWQLIAKWTSQWKYVLSLWKVKQQA